MKVLISAYACSPYKGSEPGVGWGFLEALARHHDLWVIVEEEKFRDDIERYLGEHPDFGKRVKFYFICKQRTRQLRKIWPPSYYWYYRRWHEEALALARDLHAKVTFDLAHQLTMVGFREPGYLWQLGIPFVWGPVGGMGSFPWRFLPRVGLYGALYYLGYNVINALQARLLRRPLLAARRAGTGLIAATPENQAGALKHWGCRSTVIAEVGLPPAVAVTPLDRKTGEPLRLVWTGLHLPGKALNLALAALAALPSDANWELHVLGKGPQTARWQTLATRLGLMARCHFHGWLPRDEAMHIMAASHVMLITSLRDLTSTVTVEALAQGLPIVCLDHCGFADVVNETCGIKIALRTPKETLSGLTAAIQKLEGDETLRLSLAKGAIVRAQEYAWDRKAEAVDRIYRQRMLEESGKS